MSLIIYLIEKKIMFVSIVFSVLRKSGGAQLLLLII